MVEQVKGVSYPLGEFLGPAYWRNGPEVRPPGQTDTEYEKSLLVNKENDLYHCVIYLAPGWFHILPFRHCFVVCACVRARLITVSDDAARWPAHSR